MSLSMSMRMIPALRQSLSMKLHPCQVVLKNANLTPNERLVLKLYYPLSHKKALTIIEIAEQLHFTRERIYQIKRKFLRKLRQAGDAENLLERYKKGEVELCEDQLAFLHKILK